MEEWRSIPGYEGYEASNTGHIRELDRYTLNSASEMIHRNAHDLHECNDQGYLSVNLLVGGKTLGRTIHQLVGLTFLEPVEGKTSINHIDRIKTNNSVDNLEWCTDEENSHHFWSQYGTDPILNHVYIIKDEEVALVTCVESKILRTQGWSYGNGIDTEPWIISGRCYINKDDREEMIDPVYLHQYLDKGWSRGRLVRNLRGVYKDGVQRFVPQDEIEKFLQDGWTSGGITRGWCKVIRDDIITLVSPEVLDDYLNAGWEKIRVENDHVAVHKETETKIIPRAQLEEYLLFGWRYGAYRCGLKGRCWINNSVVEQVVEEVDLEKFLQEGWIRGRITPDEAKRGMIKDGVQKYVRVSQVEEHLNQGWVLGTISSGSKGMIWIHKHRQQKLINPSEWDKYQANNWKKGKPKNTVFISNDELGRCIKIPAEEVQEYLEKGWRPGRLKYRL